MMRLGRSIEIAAMVFGLAVLTAGAQAQQPATGRGASPEGRGAGRASAEPATRPTLLFKEEWKQPPYTGTLNDENRRATQDAVTHPRLELKLYGAMSRDVGVYNHEDRFDLWNGVVKSPMAIMLRDKTSYADLTGLARLR